MWRTRLISQVATVVGLAAAATFAVIRPTTARAESLMLLPQGNCGYCNSCFLAHRVLGVGEGQGYVGLHDECTPQSCAATHGTCNISLDVSKRAPVIYAAVREAAPDALAGVLRALGEGVYLNRERGAVQVTGCDDSIALHIPLSPVQLAALASE